MGHGSFGRWRAPYARSLRRARPKEPATVSIALQCIGFQQIRGLALFHQLSCSRRAARMDCKERPERSEVHRTNAVQAFSGRLAWGDPCLSVASVYWAW